MAIDLYTDELRRITGNELYQAILDLTRIDRPPEERPREGYLLDFKEDLSDRFLRSVASFANTFGGLLIVGISEQDGRPETVVGVTTTGELKTRVASMIASNLFPCPPFEIAECDIPKDSGGRKLCVVRVRETDEVCLLAKKGEKNPVYVRIEDQSPPADASQMRSLLTRKSRSESLAADLATRVNYLATSLFVCQHNPPLEPSRTHTHHKIVLCPVHSSALRLDLVTERQFGALVASQNQGLQRLVNMSEANVKYFRSRDWCEIQFFEKAHDYERRWRLTSRGDVGFVSQTRWPISKFGASWSVFDLVADLVRMCELAREFSRGVGYYGGFQLADELNVGGLALAPDHGSFMPFFYQRLGGLPDFALNPKAMIAADENSPCPSTANAEMYVDFAGLSESLSETVAAVANQILRSLGHLLDFRALRQSIESIFLDPPI